MDKLLCYIIWKGIATKQKLISNIRYNNMAIFDENVLVLIFIIIAYFDISIRNPFIFLSNIDRNTF